MAPLVPITRDQPPPYHEINLESGYCLGCENKCCKESETTIEEDEISTPFFNLSRKAKQALLAGVIWLLMAIQHIRSRDTLIVPKICETPDLGYGLMLFWVWLLYSSILIVLYGLQFDRICLKIIVLHWLMASFFSPTVWLDRRDKFLEKGCPALSRSSLNAEMAVTEVMYTSSHLPNDWEAEETDLARKAPFDWNEDAVRQYMMRRWGESPDCSEVECWIILSYRLDQESDEETSRRLWNAELTLNFPEEKWGD